MKTAVAVVTAAALVRLMLAALVPLVPDEAYYWEWSRHLAAGYFDHPPAIAWIVRAGTAIGGDTPLGVRLAVIGLGWLGCIVVVALARRLGGDRGALRAAILMSAVPLAGIGLVLATPDVPLLVFGAIVLWAADRAISATTTRTIDRAGAESSATLGDGADRATGWWLVVGAALGAALLSKYTAVLLPAGIAIACACSARLRPQFRRPGPYLAIVVAAAMFAPVVMWNADHGWVSFAFQLQHGLGPPRGSPLGRELELLGVEVGLVTPILFPLIAYAVVLAARRPNVERPFLLAAIALFVWGFFVLSAVRHPVSPNWPALAFLPGLVVLAISEQGRRQARWERAGVGLGVAIILAVSVHAVHPWLPLQPRRDPMAQAYGWDDLARAVAADNERLSRTAGTRVWVAADRYQEASELAWSLPGHPTVFSLELASRRNQFDYWPTASDSVRLGDALTVVLDETTDVPAPVRRLGPQFAYVLRGPLVEMHWGSDRVVARRRIWHFLGLTAPLTATLGRTPP